jgi:hypothetical protein
MKFFPSIQAGYAWLYKLVVNAVAISGGTIDASTIGGTTPAAGTFTTLASNASIGIAGTTGGLVRRFSEQTVTLAGASGSILVNVPAGTRILATQLRVDTLITSGDGGASWKADFVNTRRPRSAGAGVRKEHQIQRDPSGLRDHDGGRDHHHHAGRGNIQRGRNTGDRVF